MEIELSILIPAFVAGIIILSTHIPLGQEVLRRGIIFIDLAIAQIAGLGVIAANSFGWNAHGWEVQAAAVSAALTGAFLLNLTEKKFPDIQEAIIGVLFILAATAGILLLANNPHGGEHLKELLVGQILWVELSDLLPTALLYIIVLLLWYGMREKMGAAGFYFLFAISVTASVQLVGIYLVFSCLIIPALGTVRLSGKRRLITAYGIGVAGFATGLLASSSYDLPSGAMIVWTLALCSIFSYIITAKDNRI
ncbi:MAG: metal ABC transporter permease [Gammaproteobacteria bacterium]|nr:metal ABC transporter permease [Gammaproteobacteria bacterium]